MNIKTSEVFKDPEDGFKSAGKIVGNTADTFKPLAHFIFS